MRTLLALLPRCPLVCWAYTFSIPTQISGSVHFKDLTEGTTRQEQVDEITGMSQWVVTDAIDEKRGPSGGTRSDEKRYLMPTPRALDGAGRQRCPRRRRAGQDPA